jgi:hypothetical protein
LRALALAALAAALGGAAAPAGPPTIAGCPVFPATSVWNQPVDKLRVAKDSATLIRSIGLDSPVHPDFGSGRYDGQRIGIPYVVVSGASTPKARPSFEYSDESDPGPYPIPANVPIEGDPRPDGGDRHALIVDRSTCTLYELYALQKTARGWSAGSGAIWNLRSNKLRPAGWTSADAAGLPIFPGLARYDEDAAGAIDHALRFTAPETRRAYIYPRAPLRELVDRSLAAADGAARAAEGERRRQPLPAAGAPDPGRAEEVRDDPRRQRLALVHLGGAGPALVKRRAAHARRADRSRLRGREYVSAQTVIGAVTGTPGCSVTTNVAPSPGADSTVTVPPIASVSCRTIARPRPLPTGRSRPYLS